MRDLDAWYGRMRRRERVGVNEATRLCGADLRATMWSDCDCFVVDV